MNKRKLLAILGGILLTILLLFAFNLLVYLAPVLHIDLGERSPVEEVVTGIGTEIGGLITTHEEIELPTMEVTDDNRELFVEAFECVIEGGLLKAKGSLLGLPQSDDGELYLLHYPIWETEHDYEEAILASDDKSRVFCIATEIDDDGDESLLYDRYQIAIRLDGEIFPIGNEVYITTPEDLASYKDPFPEAESKKGLLLDPMHLHANWDNPLSVKQAIYNIPLSLIIGESTAPDVPTQYYEYHGKEYAFNGVYLEMYDFVFGTLTRNDIVTTAVILNDLKDRTKPLIHPNTKDGKGYYYMVDTTDEEGCELFEAVLTYLADRYHDEKHGLISNWIIGNEVNVRQWNYMDYTDLETYTDAYAREFRLAYSAIRSRNANARIYISLDQQWDKDATDVKSYYDAKDLLDIFAGQIRAGGDIDWGLAFHPYSVPMTWPKFWELSAKSEDLVRDQSGTPMISMSNIDVLTDYMHLSRMRAPDGSIRHILLSEQGFPASNGESVQAAAIAYAYYIAEDNKYIDALLLSRETDAPEEVLKGLSLGLYTSTGTPRASVEVFRCMDDEDGKDRTSHLLDTIGASDWDEALEWVR